MAKTYHLRANTLLLFFLKALLVLVILNVIVLGLEYYFKHYTTSSITGSYSFKYYVTGMFSFDGEKNIPSFFSTINFLLSAACLFLISGHIKRSDKPLHHRKWYLLGFIFVWLAMDELLSIHELIGKPTIAFLKFLLQQDNLGALHFGWFVPYLIILALIGLYFIKFVFSLPASTLKGMVVAGVVFLTGAVGMEVVGGYVSAGGGEASILYKVCYTLEEALEMLGIILFIHTLVRYMERLGNVEVNLSFGSSAATARNAPFLAAERSEDTEWAAFANNAFEKENTHSA